MLSSTRWPLGFFFFVIVALAPAPAAAQPHTPIPSADSGPVLRPAAKLREVAIAVHLGIASKYDLRGVRESLEFPFGVDIVVEFPTTAWLMIGPRFAWRGSDLDSIDDEQSTRVDMAWLDFGPLLRFRVPITFKEESVFLEVYLSAAPALTVAVSPSTVVDRTAVGFSIDVALGIRTVFNRRIGFLFEGGWARHQADFSDASSELRSGTFRAGPVIAF